jgi:NAD(P)-dependent dehydrogenase (short-subunit alcohol dehydrogenase family)
VVQITSMGGRVAMMGLSGYHAAKFAVEGLSESLAKEVAPLGIRTTIVEPGGFRTDWAGASMDYAETSPDYAPVIEPFAEAVRSNPATVRGDPRKLAEAILRVVEMDDPPLRLPLGTDAHEFLGATYQHALAELERWKDVTRGTDYDDAPAFDEELKALVVQR